MPGKRINDPSLTRTTFTEAVANGGEVLTDWTGLVEARPVAVSLLGNAWFQGSTDNVNFSDTINSSTSYIKVSTDGGSNWRDIPLVDPADLHPALSLNIKNGLSLDATNQILSLALATTSTAGALSASDKTKIDHIVTTGDGTQFLNNAGNYITVPITAEANTASNLGTGTGLYAQKVGVDLQFKSLIAGTGVVLTPTSTGVQIDATGAGGGEVNTASNIGTLGVGVFDNKTGVDLRFRNINSLNNILTVALDAANYNIDLTVVEGNIDHNLLLNYVSTQHIDHATTSVIAGVGLTGGGTIDASVTLNFDISSLTVDPTPKVTDLIAVYDPDTLTHYYTAVQDMAIAPIWGNITGTLTNQTDLSTALNAKADNTIGIYGVAGLQGGGTLTTSRNITLDFNGLSDIPLATTDYIAFYDTSNMIHAKANVTDLITFIDNNLTGATQSWVLSLPVSTFTNDAGYLTSVTEADPIFTASPAFGITSSNITNWNTAYGWGDHALAGYAHLDLPEETFTQKKTFAAELATTSTLTHQNLPVRTNQTSKLYIDSTTEQVYADVADVLDPSYYVYPTDPGVLGKEISTDFGLDKIFSPIIINTEEVNQFLTTPTPITITAIDTVANTVTLSYLPYITKIWNPTIGKEWIVGMGEGTDGQRAGQDQAYLRITGGNYATKTLNYDLTRYEANFVVGSIVYLYNIFNNKNYNFGLSTPLISASAGTYYSQQAKPGGLFKHSDGTYRMLVNGYNGTTWQVGVFSSPDLQTWTPMFSSAPVFTYGTASWNVVEIYSTALLKDPINNGYIAYCQGKVTTSSNVGWVRFDEDFTNIEYAPTDIIDLTGTDSGVSSPDVTYFKGKYRLLVTNRSGVLDSVGWGQREYVSYDPLGPWTLETEDVFDSTTTYSSGPWRNQQYNYRSSHVDDSRYFIYNNELYALLGGTSRWNKSGSRGERIYGVSYYDRENDTFKENSRWRDIGWGPVAGSYQFANVIWNVPEGHVGGTTIIYVENNIMYIFYSITQVSNQYEMVCTTVSLV